VSAVVSDVVGSGHVVVADARGLFSVQPLSALDAALGKPPYCIEVEDS
jgi:hypothetical protein